MDVVIPEKVLSALAASDPVDEAEDLTLNVEGTDSGEDGQAAAGQPEDKDDTEAEPADEDNPAVPYSRFSEVIAAKNAAKAEAQALKRELDELRAGDFSDPDSEVDDITDHSVEARLHRIELAAAGKVLDAEVAAALTAHPDVPESVLYKAVSDDPEMDVLVVAKAYSEHIRGIKQAAVDDYKATLQAEPKVPPKLKTSGSAGKTKVKPRTLAEAHKAMRAAVRTAEW